MSEDITTLAGKTVGYEQGTTEEAYAKAVLNKAGVKTRKPTPTRIRFMLTWSRVALDASDSDDVLQAEMLPIEVPARR